MPLQISLDNSHLWLIFLDLGFPSPSVRSTDRELCLLYLLMTFVFVCFFFITLLNISLHSLSAECTYGWMLDWMMVVIVAVLVLTLFLYLFCAIFPHLAMETIWFCCLPKFLFGCLPLLWRLFYLSHAINIRLSNFYHIQDYILDL